MSDLKKHFEANMLDGEPVDDCGRAMLSAAEVWEYIEEVMDKEINSARIDELFWLNKMYRQRRDKSLIGLNLDELRDIDKDLDEIVDRIRGLEALKRKDK